MSAKAAVFDLGNVLLNWQPEAYYDTKVGPARRKEFFAGVPIDEMNDRSDLGEDLPNLVEEFAERFPEFEREVRIWWTDWIKICAPAIEGTVSILEALKVKGVPIYSLTNFGDRTFDIARQNYAFLDLFDAHFVSGRLKVMKPDAGIYEALEKATGLSGSDLIFSDDREDNILAAKARGWQTYHFKEPSGCLAAFQKAGLL